MASPSDPSMQCDHRKRANRIPSASASVRSAQRDPSIMLRMNRYSALFLKAYDELRANLPHLFAFFVLIALAWLFFTSINASSTLRIRAFAVSEFSGKLAFSQQARDGSHTQVETAILVGHG